MLLVPIVVALSCQAATPQPPPRPRGLPMEAVWAGGVDGGHWFQCLMRGKEPGASFDCTMYSDQSGQVIARGSYSLAKCLPAGKCEPVAALAPTLEYRFFDGVTIHLKQPYALLPDGEIDHPFGDGHGKRVTYTFGQEAGPERPY